VTDLLGESDSLRLFVANEIRRDDNLMGNGQQYSLTVDEIVKEYIADCLAKNWCPLPPTIVEKRLPELMMRYFQVGKSHDVPRAGKNRRGFWKVRF
jgi:hypothetical protein